MHDLKGKHDAPGLLAATELQFLRALYWLALAPAGSRVGLETGDDVVVEGSEGRQISEQDKNSIRPVGHPFTDRAIALWKTLAIWASQCQASDHASARFLLVTNRPVSEGLARRLSEADDDASVRRCIDEILSIAADPPMSLSPYCRDLLAIEPEILAGLIRRIHLCDGSELSITEHVSQLASLLHFPQNLGDPHLLIDALSGWLHRRCNELWNEASAAWIEREQFDNQYHAVVHRLRRDRSSERAARLIPLDSRDVENAHARLFVRQLLLLDTEDPDIDSAVACYLRFATERLRLIEIGDITESDWDDFFGSLVERWERIARNRLRGVASSEEKEVGRAILRDTADAGFKADLAGKRTSSEYFTSGGYHRLADDATIWWHPNYHNLTTTE